MKVVIFETEEWEHQACQRLEPEHDVTCAREALNVHTVGPFSDAEIVSTFVNSQLDALVLSHLPHLKLIATRSTGYDHIDLGWCKTNAIAVANVPNYGDSTVAEHAFALLLAVARNLVEAVERTRDGNFSQAGLRGLELHGKVLGVVGTGRIGRRAIEIAHGFGMTVAAYDTHPDEECATDLGFAYGTLDEVLAIADVLTLHVPATPETKNLISDREFGLMKRGAVLINTARGNIVDVSALVLALADGKVMGAGLDVLPQEPLIREEAQVFRQEFGDGYDLKGLVANHVLLQLPNVIVTPHNAYNTESAVRRIVETTVENIRAFARGSPRNLVALA